MCKKEEIKIREFCQELLIPSTKYYNTLLNILLLYMYIHHQNLTQGQWVLIAVMFSSMVTCCERYTAEVVWSG